MILLINVFVTDQRLSPHFKWERGTLPLNSRFDIFKYSLASFAEINRWSKVIINARLDENYVRRWDELKNFIHEIFKDKFSEEIIVNTNRCEKQREWQQLWTEHIEPNNDQLVWFCCNDDHVFLDYDLTALDEILYCMKCNSSPYKSCYFSHWPELLRIAERQNAVMTENHLEFMWQSNDSVQILSKESFKYLWFSRDYGDALVPRPDFHTQVEAAPNTFFYLPLREMCRHYDGYNHVGIPQYLCPALYIPNGFFEKAMQLRYGYPHGHKWGYTEIDPCRLDYVGINDNGTDYKWMLEDLPLFWKNRIIEIDKNKDTDELANRVCRNSGFLGIALAQYNLKPLKDMRWLSKGMR